MAFPQLHRCLELLFCWFASDFSIRHVALTHYNLCKMSRRLRFVLLFCFLISLVHISAAGQLTIFVRVFYHFGNVHRNEYIDAD